MEGLLITHQDMEDIAALDVRELIRQEVVAGDACVTFPIKNYKDLFTLAYRSQSARGVSLLLHSFQYKEIVPDFEKEIKNNFEAFSFGDWLNPKNSFCVSAQKQVQLNIKTPDLEKQLGAAIIEKIQEEKKYEQTVNLKNPDIAVFIFLTGKKCYVGIDVVGFDISKRSYNIFTHPAAIKGTIAYGLLRLAGFDGSKALLDPFSGAGIVSIEAALLASRRSPRHFDKDKFLFTKMEKFNDMDLNSFFESIDAKIKDGKCAITNADMQMKHLSFAKKNAKIANVIKQINYTRMEVDRLDLKFDKQSVDHIVSKMPSVHGKDMRNLYKEFFYQAEFILKKTGIMVLIGSKELIEPFCKEYKFSIKEERKIFSGQGGYNVFVVTK